MTGVNLFDITWFGITAWRVALSVTLLLIFVFLKIRWAREGVQPPGVLGLQLGGGLKYTDAPTVRLTDTQRIDRLHRVVTLKAGERADLQDLTFGRFSRLELVLKKIEQDSGQDYAQIHVELGGPTASCGDVVKELRDNQFLVPRAAGDDQRSSILFYCNRSEAVSFLQIKVRRIDAIEQAAAIDVLHVRGRWAG